MQYPLSENVIWEYTKSHKSSITHLNFSRDTNLLFSAGADGNLFIYCLYELPEGDKIEFDEKLTNNLNSLSNMIDEGLGDNVLYPIDKIFKYEDATKVMKDQIAHSFKILVESQKQSEKEYKEKEGVWTREKNTELKILNDKINEIVINKDIVTEYYEEKLLNKEKDFHEALTDQKRTNEDQIEILGNKVVDLSNQIEFLVSGHSLDMK